MNPFEENPLKNSKPSPLEDRLDHGFAERDAVLMIDGLLALKNEQELHSTMEDLLVRGLTDQLDSDLVVPGDALNFAASHDLIRFRDLLVSLQDKSLMEVRSALMEYKEKELAVRTGRARTPGL